jgi:hypothetical protein
MPFQSEKQRRYLHANHPEIAKRWERDYAHGGILDINESEEIIDDGGNEIELTDYNADFDNPNDFSTGVKSLFRAKKGGQAIGGGMITGEPRGDRTGFWDPGGKSPGSSSSSGPGPGGQGARGQATQNPGVSSTGGGYQNVHQTGAVSQTPGRTTTTSTGGDGYQDRIIEVQERQRKADLKEMANTYEDTWGKWNDKYDKLGKYSYSGSGVKKRAKLTDQNYNEDRAALEKKFGKSLVKKILGAIVLGMPISIGYNDIKAVKSMYDLEQKYRADMGKLKQISLDKGWATSHHAVDTPFQTIEQLMLDTIRVRDDDTGGPDGPEPILDPTTLEVGTEYAQGYYGMSDLDRIRAGQAKRAMINPDWQNTENILVANRGGLANLFRVKNQ